MLSHINQVISAPYEEYYTNILPHLKEFLLSVVTPQLGVILALQLAALVSQLHAPWEKKDSILITQQPRMYCRLHLLRMNICFSV